MDEPKILVAHALDCWINYLETGNIILSAQDAKAQKKPYHALSKSQMELILELTRIKELVLEKGIIEE